MAWQRAASIFLFIAVWWIAAALADSRLLPAPDAVVAAIVKELENGRLLYHLGATLARVAASFFIAMLIGGVIGAAMGLWRSFDRWADGWILILLNIPALVAIILCYVWLGLNETAAILAVSINKIPNVAVTLREGARALDRDYSEMAAAYRFGPVKTIFHVILPPLYPFILAAARNGLALVWKIVLVVELLGRSNGIGFMLHSFFQLFEITQLMAYTIAFVLVVLAIEMLIIQPLDVRANRWRR